MCVVKDFEETFVIKKTHVQLSNRNIQAPL